MKRTDFESINEELMTELILARALEMESWVSSLELDPNIDTSFLDEAETYGDSVVMLDEADLRTAQAYETLGRQTSNDLLLRATSVMRMMEDQDLDEGVEACTDCGEWLQLHRSSILSRAKSYAKHLKGAGYDVDDVFQEINLTIFTSWNKYDPSCETREKFCWYVVNKHMLELYRNARAQKRDYAVTESLNAVAFAHLDSEWINGTVTWMSLVGDDKGQEDGVLMMDTLNEAMANIQEKDREVLSMLAEGYTQMEIADIIGRSQGSVSGIASRGRKALKAAIA